MIADGYIPLREMFLRWLARHVPADLVWQCGLRIMEHAAKHHPPDRVTLSDALIDWHFDQVRGHVRQPQDRQPR